MRVAAPDPRSTIAARIFDEVHGTAYTKVDGRDVGTPYVRYLLAVDVDGETVMEGCPQFGPADDSFPPRACGSCDLWECNSSESYSTWVRRTDELVVWIDPNSEVKLFDGPAYEAALRLVTMETASWLDLPRFDFAALSDRADGWLGLDKVHELSPELQIAIDAAIVIPDRWDAPVSIVVPPAEAIVVVEDRVWLANEAGAWRMFAPSLHGMPAWLAGDVIDDIARALGI